MPSILITAFEPYGDWSENASWLALVELTRHLPTGSKITTRLYPVDVSAVDQRLQDDLPANYDVALHLGQAPGAPAIRLELFGLNVANNSVISQESGFTPIKKDGPAAYQSQLPLAGWADTVRRAGIPIELSFHAGVFLCNAAQYLSCYWASSMGLKTQSAFVHLPLTPGQAIGSRDSLPSLSSSEAARAIRIIIDAI